MLVGLASDQIRGESRGGRGTNPVKRKDGMLGDGIMSLPADTTRGEDGCSRK